MNDAEFNAAGVRKWGQAIPRYDDDQPWELAVAHRGPNGEVFMDSEGPGATRRA